MLVFKLICLLFMYIHMLLFCIIHIYNRAKFILYYNNMYVNYFKYNKIIIILYL